MNTTPVLLLLLFSLLLLLLDLRRTKEKSSRPDVLFLSVLFLFSGMPALIYQIVWQRVLFSIYGVNSQSVAVVVSAFLIGLGLGSLLGGCISAGLPSHAIRFFGIAELGVAVFGLSSLKIFHWFATFTSGARLGPVVLYSLLLLLLPTMLMGATLPLLMEHLVLSSRSVGTSISRLYFVNTLGSAIACYLCATFLLREFSQSGAVILAALLNTLVGAIAYIYASRREPQVGQPNLEPIVAAGEKPPMRLPTAMLLALVVGCIALGYEICWFRLVSIASSDRAPAFALLLATYLSGIAVGSYFCERFATTRSPHEIAWLIGTVFLLSGAISPFLPPLVASVAGSNSALLSFLSTSGQNAYLYSSPAFFFVAMLLGAVLPLLCRLSISADEFAGRRVSLVYASNILGCVIGSLGIGFMLMQYFGLRQIAIFLAGISILAGICVLALSGPSLRRAPKWLFGVAALSAALIPTAASKYALLYEKLIFHHAPESRAPFARIVENRNGVIAVLQNGAVFGGGVYDGVFRIDPMDDKNLIVRALALGAMHPHPRRVLVVGLASGSWAQLLINHPETEAMDIVEINPGYLDLIPRYPIVRSLLTNPKAHVYIDDGRRWLVAHPMEKYDLIVANTTYHWRDHASTLLSKEFLQLIRPHLKTGGIYFFNATESDETMATALSIFPYGLRVINCLAVSDSPIPFDTPLWMSVLPHYRLEGRPLFDPLNPGSQRVLNAYRALEATLTEPPRFLGLESGDSIRKRLGKLRLITDDNMGLEWERNINVPPH
jgi:spermidine synthase